MTERTGFWHSLSRAQVASVIATAVDNLIYLGLVEVAGLWYVFAVATGAFCGAVTHFLLSRLWVFRAREEHWLGQAWKYALVSAGSLLLNTAGVYLFTDVFHFHKHVSKVTVAILVALFYNFPLHRYMVFK